MPAVPARFRAGLVAASLALGAAGAGAAAATAAATFSDQTTVSLFAFTHAVAQIAPKLPS